MNALRRTGESRLAYWLIGTLLLWLILPLDLMDMLQDPEWAMPNPRCDSLGIPMGQTVLLALPWAFVSATVAALLVLPVRHRANGADILAWRLGHPLANALVSAGAAVLMLPFLYEFGWYVVETLVPQTIGTDCGGRAELVELTRRGPPVQFSPFLGLAIALWLLHIRALLLSPRRA